jgi:hypothetical protein
MSELMKSRFLRAILQTATIVLLLFAVAGLSTLAKNSQYFPKSNPTHYVNIASKMKVAPLPNPSERQPLYPIAKVLLPQPCVPKHPTVEETPVPFRSIGVSASIRHRAPPPSFS